MAKHTNKPEVPFDQDDGLDFDFDALLEGAKEMVEVHQGTIEASREWRYEGHILVEIKERGDTVWNLKQGAKDLQEHLNEHEPPDVKQFIKVMRACLKQTQKGLAELMGVSVKSVRNWEQASRQPEGPARRLLAVTAQFPEEMLQSEDLLPC